MKTKMQLMIAIIIGLAVGFGTGRYTAHFPSVSAQMQVTAMNQHTGSQDLLAAHARLDELRGRYTDLHPVVISAQAQILELEKKRDAK